MSSNTIKERQDQQKLHEDLNTLSTWEKQWTVNFHMQKCYTLSAGFECHPQEEEDCTIISDEWTHLAKHQHYEYLSINIQDNLNWGHHTNIITNKTNMTLMTLGEI